MPPLHHKIAALEKKLADREAVVEAARALLREIDKKHVLDGDPASYACEHVRDLSLALRALTASLDGSKAS